MTVVRATIDIAVPPQRVWDLIMDPQRFGDWVTIHRELLHADEGELREGFEVRQRLALAGAPFSVHWRLAQLDAPSIGVWEGEGPARSRARIDNRLAEHEGGTRFDYVNEYHNPGGLMGRLAGQLLVGGLAERELNRSLHRLKRLLEAS